MRDKIFIVVLFLLVVQRLFELRISTRHTKALFRQGGVEHGASHYPLLIILHSCFFASLIAEFLLGISVQLLWPFLGLSILAQVARYWTIRSLGERWTTRIITLPGYPLVRVGPYKYMSHPNYVVVAVEILSIPLAFGLFVTAIVFTLLNATVLLCIRIPAERKALSAHSERLE